MAFQTATIAGSTSSNFTYDSDEIEFVSGHCRLVDGFFGTSLVLMDHDVMRVGDWDRTHAIAASVREAAGYEHRFAVSFDSGVTWRTYRAGLWFEVTAAQIFSRGMPAHHLAQIRDLPEGTPLRIAFAVRRLNQSPTPEGWLEEIAIQYLEEADPDEVATDFMREVPADTSGIDEVPQGYVYPFEATPTLYGEEHVSEKGYVTALALATAKARETVPLTSAPMTKAEAEAWAGFFRERYGQPVKLRAPHEALVDSDWRFFTPVSEPTLSQKAPDVWTVTIRLIELIERA